MRHVSFQCEDRLIGSTDIWLQFWFKMETHTLQCKVMLSSIYLRLTFAVNQHSYKHSLLWQPYLLGITSLPADVSTHQLGIVFFSSGTSWSRADFQNSPKLVLGEPSDEYLPYLLQKQSTFCYVTDSILGTSGNCRSKTVGINGCIRCRSFAVQTVQHWGEKISFKKLFLLSHSFP